MRGPHLEDGCADLAHSPPSPNPSPISASYHRLGTRHDHCRRNPSSRDVAEKRRRVIGLDKHAAMLPQRKKPEDVVNSVLRRVELAKIARRLQNCLALAQFKTEHGYEDLSFDAIELAYEEEIQQNHFAEYDLLSHSAPFIAQLPHPSALPSLSHEADPSLHASGYTNHRKRSLFLSSFEDSPCNPGKRSRPFLTATKASDDRSWENSQERARPSDIEQTCHRRITSVVQCSPSPSPAASEDDNDFLPTVRPFHATNLRPSLMTRSPPTPLQMKNNPDPVPSIIPPDDGNLIPTTPKWRFDWADFINATPHSLVQNPGRTISPIHPSQRGLGGVTSDSLQ